MAEFASFTRFDVDHSQEWLFIRITASSNHQETTATLAERIWSFSQGKTVRIVMEFDPDVLLNSELVGQIVRLHKRAHTNGGVLRLCGLSPSNYQVLRIAMLADRLPNFRDREAAVMGYR